MRAVEPIARFDLAVSSFCLQHRFNLQVANLSKWVSRSGDGHLYVVTSLLLWVLDSTYGTQFLYAGLLAFSIELPIYWVLKNSFKRRRPEEFSDLLPSFITPSDRYSLPSGHTAAAFVMATIISYFYPQWSDQAYAWAALIALSRVLLGVHFLTDVLLGAVLGYGCAQMALSQLGGI
ncbi:phosphatase PAP2 family protein [Vibrio sonorensis]|uniref:phosphatase PAP2 family protein n=1 Tax=Vibrio sonorensis TaxID=1004316 RepID=UPI0008D96ACE|nr:phosphatase PAP2 family protein [Vibrio sonorensis]